MARGAKGTIQGPKIGFHRGEMLVLAKADTISAASMEVDIYNSQVQKEPSIITHIYHAKNADAPLLRQYPAGLYTPKIEAQIQKQTLKDATLSNRGEDF